MENKITVTVDCSNVLEKIVAAKYALLSFEKAVKELHEAEKEIFANTNLS